MRDLDSTADDGSLRSNVPSTVVQPPKEVHRACRHNCRRQSVRVQDSRTLTPEEQLAEQLKDPAVVGSLLTLLDHADLLAVLVTGLDQLISRSEVIGDSVLGGIAELRASPNYGASPNYRARPTARPATSASTPRRSRVGGGPVRGAPEDHTGDGRRGELRHRRAAVESARLHRRRSTTSMPSSVARRRVWNSSTGVRCVFAASSRR